MSTKHVVVLGGGISGLTSAFYLAKGMVSTGGRVTLLESSSALGGWIQTKQIDEFLFEKGPRGMRPIGEIGETTLDLVSELGLASDVITIDSSSRDLFNRYIYDGETFHRLPHGIIDTLLHPKSLPTRGIVKSILREPFVKRRKDMPTTSISADGHREYSDFDDESIFDFAQRRLGDHPASWIVDPMCHGIYAGNARKLSLRSCFPFLYECERDSGSIVRGLLSLRRSRELRKRREQGRRWTSPKTLELIRRLGRTPLWSFRNGMQQLPMSMSHALTNMPNVDVRMDTAALSMCPDNNGGVNISTDDDILHADHVISTVNTRALSSVCSSTVDAPTLLALEEGESVDVGIVNMGWRSKVLPKTGFGYLVPSTVNSPILGVIFDSCSFPEQGPSTSNDITRLTVMMGGHKFHEFFAHSDSSLNVAIETAARGAITNQLGISASPDVVDVSVQRQCIPQYYVGHSERLATIRTGLTTAFQGHVSVTGANFNGVSINDCIKNARDEADRVLYFLSNPPKI